VRNRSNVRRDGREALPRLLARASGLDRGVPVLPEVRPGRQRNLATTAGERFESAFLAAEHQQDTVGEGFGAAALDDAVEVGRDDGALLRLGSFLEERCEAASAYTATGFAFLDVGDVRLGLLELVLRVLELRLNKLWMARAPQLCDEPHDFLAEAFDPRPAGLQLGGSRGRKDVTAVDRQNRAEHVLLQRLGACIRRSGAAAHAVVALADVGAEAPTVVIGAQQVPAAGAAHEPSEEPCFTGPSRARPRDATSALHETERRLGRERQMVLRSARELLAARRRVPSRARVRSGA
jgi:hypothetical protein